MDDEERYSAASGDLIRWTEGSTSYNGTTDRVYFNTVTTANAVISGTGAALRVTYSGLTVDEATALVAADRILINTGTASARIVGIATAGTATTEVVVQFTSIRADAADFTDGAVIGGLVAAAGVNVGLTAFATVTIVADAPSPTNLVEDFHSVANAAARTALTSSEVKFGDLVFQQDDNSFWGGYPRADTSC